MPLAASIALAASGVFLLVGLLCGVWKYHGIVTSPERRAHVYVDIAHRAALMYSFACLVMMKLVEPSPYSTSIQLGAVVIPIFFFAAAVASYVWHGVLRDTDNQLRESGWVTNAGMIALIVGELGGILVLVWGFLVEEFL
jgi:hypothetical protein